MSLVDTLSQAVGSVGSILVFLVVLSLMVVVHELGHFMVAKRAGIKVEEFGIGFPPRVWSKQRGETLYSINALPLGGFVRMLGEDDPTDPRSLARSPKLWRLAVLVAGSTMNFLLAILIFAVAFMAGWPTVTQSEVQVLRATAGQPAAQAGIKDGDVIVALGDQQIKGVTDLRAAAESYAGQPTTMTVRRESGLTDLSITPRATWPEGEGPLGVAIGDRATKVEPVYYSLPAAILRGISQTAQVVELTFTLPVMAFRGALPIESVRPVGPVGIYNIASQAVTETVESGWWFSLLSVGASLSAGLGLANLLPIPGLDGGRILFVLIEAIRGKRIAPEREGMIHLVGLAVLFTLVIFITFFDISQPMNVDWGLR